MIRIALVLALSSCAAAPVAAHHKPGVTHDDIRMTCYALGLVYGKEEEQRCLRQWGLE